MTRIVYIIQLRQFVDVKYRFFLHLLTCSFNCGPAATPGKYPNICNGELYESNFFVLLQPLVNPGP